ncbi:MAG TPA: ROK family protein [Sphingomicrobium sp.]
MTYAGVELGGTKCVAILARRDGEVLARETVPTTSPDETLERIERTLLGWKQDAGFEALGIASFGPVDVDPGSTTYGHVLATPKPEWEGTNVARLGKAAGVPWTFDTDVNAAALAEMHWGSGRGLADFAYVTVGTGIGVGLIVNGRPTRGFAHCELGHARAPRFAGDDWPGSCPFHGDCIEGLASGSALAARFGERMTDLKPDDPVWESVAWTLGQLCHVIVCAAAPLRIAMGGGVMEAQPHLLARAQTALIESLNGYIRIPEDGDYVLAPELGADAGPLGAIVLAMSAKR